MRQIRLSAGVGLVAWAIPFVASAQEQAPPTMASTVVSIVPFALMFLVMYTLLMRPAQKQRKEHEEMQASLKRDDEVVTQSGFIGRIAAIDDAVVTLEVGERERVKLRVLRDRVSGLWDGKANKGTGR